MRLSVEKAKRLNIISDVRVRFNGADLFHCIFADEEKGIVVVNDFDAFSLGMEFIPTKVLHGDVWLLMGDHK